MHMVESDDLAAIPSIGYRLIMHHGFSKGLRPFPEACLLKDGELSGSSTKLGIL